MDLYNVYLNLLNWAAATDDDGLADFFMLELVATGLFDIFEND